MKYALVYYSGAGNTEYLAGKIGRALLKGGNDVYTTRITTKNLAALDGDFEILGVGLPIYFRNAPDLVLRFQEHLNGSQRGIFFFATKGMYSGNVVRNVMKLSVERKCIPMDTSNSTCRALMR